MPETLTAVAPFGIEIDHPRNCDVLIQSIPGARLRSAIDGSKPIKDQKTGDLLVPLDQARHLSAFPKTPGMQLHVNPEKLEYAIVDPLHGDEALCERVRRYLNQQTGTKIDSKINGASPQKGTLDAHRMKTLCREMFRLVESGEARRVKGPLPDIEDINGMPGKYLLNPGSRIQNTQPMYEEDFDDWVTNLSRMGG